MSRLMLRVPIILFFLLMVTFCHPPHAPADSYFHDKWITKPTDQVFNFAAYTTSFDGLDDNDGDGDPDVWGVPEWVAFEVKRETVTYSSNRPSRWMTNRDLFMVGVAPDHNTYHVRGTNKLREVKSNYRFVRGHMCPKAAADRVSANAAYNTHTVLNAVPQLQWQNNGIWKKLEKLTLDWADNYGRVWVITGPVFFNKNPSMWLGQDGEVKAAIPDALFKIIVKDTGDIPDVLSFMMPNIIPPSEQNLEEFLVSVDRIESLTGLDFLTVIDDPIEEYLEKHQPQRISW